MELGFGGVVLIVGIVLVLVSCIAITVCLFRRKKPILGTGLLCLVVCGIVLSQRGSVSNDYCFPVTQGMPRAQFDAMVRNKFDQASFDAAAQALGLQTPVSYQDFTGMLTFDTADDSDAVYCVSFVSGNGWKRRNRAAKAIAYALAMELNQELVKEISE